MTCTCITDVPKKVLEKVKPQDYKVKSFTKAEFKHTTLLLGPKISSAMYYPVEVESPERKRPIVITMLGRYCPFCGTKRAEDESKTNTDEQAEV